VAHAFHALAIDERRAPFAPSLWDPGRKPGQSVQQLWFPGTHSDVGGGNPDRSLSDIALQWMIDCARGVGLAFDDTPGDAPPLAPDPLGPMHESRTGLYRLSPGRWRPIGGDHTQAVHASALERWRADAAYRPANLRQWLAQQPAGRSDRGADDHDDR
jgi:hypothetical protein